MQHDEPLMPAINRPDAGLSESGGSSTYDVRVGCGNCGMTRQISIPKGRTVSQTPCPECGNMTLRR